MSKPATAQKQKLFSKDFTLMIIGQIISIFGNNILRYALPIYLYNQTGSATLLGIVTACSFIPMILLSPVGGILADRVNKRNVMVVLDFATAAITLIFTILLGQVNLVALLIITLMLLYGIQGSYQPAVQAAVPSMVSQDNIMPANATANLVNSLAGLIGPVVGGMLLAFYGLTPILIISIISFFVSAVMEIFIHIPFTKQDNSAGIWQIVKGDMRQSVHFVVREQPVIGKGVAIIAAFNLFLSAMLMVGSAVIITGTLGFSEALGNQLYGYTQGALAAGGLAGGVLAGVLGKKLKVHQVHVLLLAAAISIVPMGLTLVLGAPAMVSYVIFTVCAFIMMAFATIFSIQMITFVQQITPENMVGKVISFVMAICMCAQPLGSLLYGYLFEYLGGAVYTVLFFSAAVSIIISLASKKVFSALKDIDIPAQQSEAITEPAAD